MREPSTYPYPLPPPHTHLAQQAPQREEGAVEQEQQRGLAGVEAHDPRAEDGREVVPFGGGGVWLQVVGCGWLVAVAW
jgi:hypothetical protein